MLAPTKRPLAVAVTLFVGSAILLSLTSCRSTVPRRDPTGEMFPRVVGEALDGTRMVLPDDKRGEPCVLLVGYRQETQFDLDRWILGIDQAGLAVALLEVPTLPGLGPRLASGYIDDGMRSGIPSEDWSSVVCVYGDAPRIVGLTGNENPRPGRVLLLDAEGRIAFFHDTGYSASSLRRLAEALSRLRKTTDSLEGG